MRFDTLPSPLPIAGSLFLCTTVSAQTLEWDSLGASVDDAFGYSVAFGETRIGNQTVETLIVSSPFADVTASGAGQVRVFRADDGTQLATWNGASSFDQFGRTVVSGGDLNNDGIDDILVSAHLADTNGANAGAVYVYSGATLTPFFYSPIVGTHSPQQMGFGVAILDDVNGDGRDDIAAGSPYGQGLFSPSSAGKVTLFSGLNGSSLGEIFGGQESAHFGSSIGSLGDVDGDGFGDLIVGEPEYDVIGIIPTLTRINAGRATVYSGATRTAIFASLVGTQTDERFGFAVAGSGDVNGDGTPDFLVGSPKFDGVGLFGTTAADAGRVTVRSGSSNAELYAFSSLLAGVELGYSVAGGADIDHDGRADFMYGGPSYDGENGRVVVHSGRTGAERYRISGEDGERLGRAVAMSPGSEGSPDIYDDFAVGSPEHDLDGLFGIVEGAGGVALYLGKPRGYLTGANQTATGVAVAGDVNGDGFDDILVGHHQPTPLDFPRFGYALYSGKDEQLLHAESSEDTCPGIAVTGIGDVDGDGRADYALGNPCDTLVEIRSGFSHQVLRYLTDPGYTFGAVIANAGDVNGDGFDDLLVGDPDRSTALGQDSTGFVWLYSGASLAPGGPSAVLRTHVGVEPGERLGASLAGAGDVDNDGFQDYILGAPNYSGPSSNLGRMEVRSGLTGAQLFFEVGSSPGDRLGSSVAGAGDVNADGFGDVIVGVPNAGVTSTGRAVVIAGPSGTTQLFNFIGDQGGMHLGATVASIGDVDRDGFADLAVSAPDYDGQTIFGTTQVDRGLVRIFSGASGANTGSFGGLASGEHFGSTLAGQLLPGEDNRTQLVAGAPDALYDDHFGYARVMELPFSDVTILGSGCGSSPAPTLGVTAPRVGELMTMFVSNAILGSAWIWVATGEASIPTGAGCVLYVDPGALLGTLAVPLVGTAGEIDVWIPNAPAFVGVNLAAQAFVLLPNPSGYGLSPGARLEVGY